MTMRGVGELACRVLAIYALIATFTMLQFPVSLLQFNMAAQRSALAVAFAFVPAILVFVLGLFLWCYAGRLAARMIAAPDSPPESVGGISPEVVQRIAFSVAGIFILIDSVPYCGQAVIQLSAGHVRQNLWLWLNLVTSLIRLVIGSWLLLGSKNLRKIMTWLSGKDW